jgi:hypothetical protein
MAAFLFCAEPDLRLASAELLGLKSSIRLHSESGCVCPGDYL